MELGLQGLQQVSMDGPSVNWTMVDQLSLQVERECQRKLLNVGSCGLHTLHNAFRHGCEKTSWNIDHLLTCLYWLFKDLPARREDYTAVTGSNVFPEKSCAFRWVENAAVLERVLEMWPQVKSYAGAVQVKKVKRPKNKSFTVVQDCCCGDLFEVKVQVLLTISKVVTPICLIPNRYAYVTFLGI